MVSTDVTPFNFLLLNIRYSSAAPLSRRPSAPPSSGTTLVYVLDLPVVGVDALEPLCRSENSRAITSSRPRYLEGVGSSDRTCLRT
jgi:hypothetical protein